MVVLVLAVVPKTVFADPAMARIITGNERITQCIASVHIRQLDGEERQLPANSFELEPGMHTLHGASKINVTYCQVNRASQQTSVPPLTALFEAGKNYYVGLDHSAPDWENWRIVVWKVEDREE
jgi:hypothetical protein